jgi:transcriptional regulator with XRE-family HTH domain
VQLWGGTLVRVDGRKLREWRQRRLLTLRELAAKSGVQFHTIHAIETGKQEPRVSTVRKLISALDIPAEELLTLDREDLDQSTDA